jgi:iron complex outermembrane receptor protein
MKASLWWTCAFLAPMFWTGVAAAQDSATDEEIIVTAQKREQSVQDVPISMNVYAGEELSDNNITSLQSMTDLVPGMVYIESPTIPVLQLRGFASPANNPSADQTVAVYQDGIFGGRARQFQRPFFDTQRVEVLRGPQGALLGKNTAAGALSIVSNSPTEAFEAGLTNTYLFDREGAEGSGFISGALSDVLSARGAFNYSVTSRGWLNNVGNGQHDPRQRIASGRISLDYHPSENFENLTRFEYSDVAYHGTAGANFPGTVPLEDVIRYIRNMPGVFGEEDGLQLTSYQATNTATLRFGELELVSISGATGFRGDSIGGGGANNPEVFGTTLLEEFEQYSQELRLVSPTGGRFEWIAGIYGDFYTYNSENIPRYRLAGGAVNGQGHTYFGEEGNTLSIYATGTYHATDALQLIAGARYTQTEKDGDLFVAQDFGPPFGYVPGISRAASISNEFFDPSFTVQYDISPDVMVYGSYQQGSKGGAFQSTNRTVTQARFALEPEQSESYEIGVRSQFGDWLTLNLAAFQLTFENLQSSQYVGTPPTLTVVNVGEARSEGIEYTVTVRPFDTLSFSAVGAYINAEFLDYAGAPCTFAQLQTGCVNGTINAAGRPLSGVPEFSGTVSMDYRSEVREGIDLFFSGTANHETRSNVDANVQNPLYGFKEENIIYGARLGFGASDGSWELALIGHNITDELTWNSSIAWGPPFVATQTVNTRINPGRSIGLQLKIER